MGALLKDCHLEAPQHGVGHGGVVKSLHIHGQPKVPDAALACLNDGPPVYLVHEIITLDEGCHLSLGDESAWHGAPDAHTG